MPRCGPGSLSGYGDLTDCGAAECRDRTARPADDIAWMRVPMRCCGNLGWTRGRRTTLRQCKAKLSAIGTGRWKADVALVLPKSVIMLPLATQAVLGSLYRG
jgi:hypothetical protein